MFKICIFQEIDSTSTYAKNLIINNDANNNSNLHCCAFLSYSQTASFGKLGSKWCSLEGNLGLSFIMKQGREQPSHKDTLFHSKDDFGYINLAVSTCLRDSILHYLSGEEAKVTYKWPNDILLNEAKVAGILMEVEEDKQQNKYLVIGVGVNLKASPLLKDYPSISIQDVTAKPISPLDFAQRFLEKISILTSKKLNTQEILTNWLEHAQYLNQEISIKVGNNIESGIFKTIDEKGYLILEKDYPSSKGSNKDILTKRISAGEIFDIEKKYKHKRETKK